MGDYSAKIAVFMFDMATLLKVEWQNRTLYGKLWYPVWLSYNAVKWSFLLGMLLPFAILAAYMRHLESENERESNVGPDIYKGEGK